MLTVQSGLRTEGNPGLSPHKQGGDVTMSTLKYEAFDATNTSMNFPTVSLKSRL